MTAAESIAKRRLVPFIGEEPALFLFLILSVRKAELLRSIFLFAGGGIFGVLFILLILHIFG